MTFNNKLIRLRKANAMSQEELAEKLNVSRQAISKWELGDVSPDSDKIVALSNLFGVTTDYLLKDELENPATTIIMRSDPNKNIIISKILRFLSTFLYAMGLLVAWIMWANASDKFVFDGHYYNGPYNLGAVAIFVGILIQSIGFACYYFANNFHKSRLSLGQIYLNFLFLHYMPLCGVFSFCVFGTPTPYPSMPIINEGEDMMILWGIIIHIIFILIVGLAFYCKYKKQKKQQLAQNKE